MLDYGARQSLFQGTDVVLRRWPSTFLFDFNMVITNLNKVDKAEAMELISTLRQSIQSSAELNKSCAQEFADIPLVGKTIFEQRQMLYGSLLE